MFYIERGVKNIRNVKDNQKVINFWVPLTTSEGTFKGVVGIQFPSKLEGLFNKQFSPTPKAYNVDYFGLFE